MGNFQSLSKEAQDVLDAAKQGDVEWFKHQIATEPALVTSVTLLKRRGVLHLAAKQGHPDVISAVLEPLIEAVREEYHAQQELIKSSQEAEQGCQQQQEPDPAHAQQRPQQQSHSQSVLLHNSLQPQQQPELQLSSFKKLRQTVNARDLYRRTPLIVAAKQGHLDCTQLLVEAASNLFAVDREGNTSLHYAALHSHANVVEYLLQKATDRNLALRFVNKRNLSGFSPLHYAVWGCNEQLVQALLQAGADVCVANDRVFDAWVTVPVGSTPLHLAVVRNSMPIALLLLQHYVLQLISSPSDAPLPQDPRSIVNLYGMNPAQLAAHRGHRQLARVLVPSLSLTRVLEAFGPGNAPRSYGPPSLKAIAVGVMKARLADELQQLEAAQRQQLQAALLSETSGQPHNHHNSKHQLAHMADACCNMCCSSSASASPCCCSNQQQQQLPPPSPSTDSTSSSAGLPDLEVLQDLLPDSPLAAKAANCSSRGKGCAHGEREGSSILGRATSSGWYDEQCCVCWEEDVSVTIGPCMHALCLACARQLVDSSGQTGATCPLCRSYIGGFGLLPMQPGGLRMKLVSGAGI